MARLLNAPKRASSSTPRRTTSPPDAATVQPHCRAWAGRGPLRLIAVGNLIDRKGIHDVIAALATLRKARRLHPGRDRQRRRGPGVHGGTACGHHRTI
ncbi:MAG: hypothetical protein R2838_14560 [Caldilineaceae bacterium]